LALARVDLLVGGVYSVTY